MGIPNSEQETVIVFGRTDSGAIIDTSDSTVITRIEKLRKQSPENYRLEAIHTFQGGDECGRKYRVTDKGLISFRKGRLRYSDEEKRRKAEHMKKIREASP